MRKENELLTDIDSGIQAVNPQLATPQVIYLVFDGVTTSYHNRELDIKVGNVTVADSGFDTASISVIVAALNGQFGDDVVFTADIPSEGQFSTIYIGVTSAFDEYGSFLGLAETIDSGNQIHDDNAFVLLDSTATTEYVVSVIAHETGHIVYGSKHDGEGLSRFAETIIVSTGTITSQVVSYGLIVEVTNGATVNSTTVTGGSMSVSDNGMATATTVLSGGELNVSSGGTATWTYVEKGFMNVLSGGTATGTYVVGGFLNVSECGGTDDTSLNSGGWLGVGSGCTANSTTVYQDGSMTVSSGGTATAIVENGGFVYLDEGATATFVENMIYELSLENRSATIHSGTTAFNVTMNSYADLQVYNGGVVSSVVASGANIHVSGGTANGMTLENTMIEVSGGTVSGMTLKNAGLTVDNGGIVNSAVASNAGIIVSGGTVNNVTICEYDATLAVHDGGTANSTTVTDEGRLGVSSGGTVNSTTVYLGSVFVEDGGSATETTVFGGGQMNVIYGGSATRTTVCDGQMNISSGGTANSTTVSGGQMNIEYGGSVTETTVFGGQMNISSGGTANSTTVNNGGGLRLYGGTANSTTVSSGATLNVFNGATVNSTTVTGGSMNVSDNGMATATTVLSGGELNVSSGGTATGTHVEKGFMNVLSGGTATGTYVVGGFLNVSECGGTDDTSLNSGGWLGVGSGCTANSTTVYQDGSMTVSSGGTATAIVENGGFVYLDEGATATFVENMIYELSLENRSATIHSGTTAFNVTMNSYADLQVYNGGVVSSVVASGANIHVSGGTANGMTLENTMIEVSGGTVSGMTLKNAGLTVDNGGIVNSAVASNAGIIVSGGTVNNVTICEYDATLAVHDGGTANSTTVTDEGRLGVSSGGTVNSTTVYLGSVFVEDGGSATETTVFGGGQMNVIYGGSATKTTVFGGQMNISSGGTANSTTVNSGGYMSVASATANETTVNSGCIEIGFAGIVQNIIVSSGGSLIISSNGMIRGEVSIASGANVSALSDAKIDFTVAEQTVLARPLIDYFGNISVADYVSFSITVAAEQASGVYALAGDAKNFKSKSAWVKTVADTGIGTLSVGASITDASRRYSLLMDSDNTLALKVTKYHTVTKTTAGGEGSFDDAAAAGEAILFSDSVSYYYTNGLTAATAMEVIGNGTTETTLSGGNLYMAGNAASFSNLTLDGMVFGGVAASIGLGITENVSLSFSGVNFADGKRVYGGADVSDIADATVGNITLALEGASGAGARIFGAGRVADSAKLIVGNIDITVSCAEGGSFVNLFAGADVVTGFNGSIEGHNVSTVIEGGTFTYAGNGSQLRGGESKQWDSTLTVNGGTFQHYVYAGAFSMGGTATVQGDTALVINGGTFETHVFGGCGANNSDNGDKTLVSGDAGVIVNAKDATITFNGNVYAGSMGKGIINGETAMTFSGFGSNLSFASDSYVTGGSQMARGTEKYIGGDQTLAFNGFTGDFGANVNNGFSRIVATNSNVVFTGKEEVKLNAISSWEIEAGTSEAEIALGDAKNSFKGDTLTLTLAEDAELGADAWDVISGTETSLTGWDKFSSVNLAGEAATFADGEWGSENYRLFRDGNILKLATIA